MSKAASKRTVISDGIIGSRGVGLARCYVFKKRIETKCKPISKDQLKDELARLEAAFKVTAADISQLRQKAKLKHGEKYAEIFDSHLLMLEDRQFKPKVIERLKKNMVNAECVVKQTVDEIQSAFMAIEDPYLKERAIDIKDVGERLLKHLMGLQEPTDFVKKEPYILIAQELTPSEILDFAKSNLVGVCLDTGGATSHVAILAGALGIPSVFGLGNFSLLARSGDKILLDTSEKCTLILAPSKKDIENLNKSTQKTNENAVLSDTTKDGCKLNIAVNIGRVEELELLKHAGIKRIGLFRSEFVFMDSADLPSEELQTDVYTKVVKAAPEMAVLRTIDIGSDKPLRYIPLTREENPAMGFRSVRFSLSRPDILEPQLRAMVKAAQHGSCRIIFPMVSAVSELKAISEAYNRVIEQLKPKITPEWGIMLEVPSAVFMLKDIARYTKYISLGTNDLTQFFFALDRTNEKLAGIAGFLNLSFLRLVNRCVKEAKELGITVAVCGEMASDICGMLCLIGMGVNDLSVRPSAVKKALGIIPAIEKKEVCKFVQNLINEPYEQDVRSLLQKTFTQITK